MAASLAPFTAALRDHRDFTEAEAQRLIEALMRGGAGHEEMAGLLTAWQAKGVAVDELVGAARAMRALATPITVRLEPLLDTCGTGGDGLQTFNISTVAALVAAGAGARVAKHGNRGATSVCGSADLLTALGVKVDAAPAVVARCIEEIGFGFLFAPQFHPTMRQVAPVRQQLGFRTIFNLLGPLTNPAGVTHQIVGVSDAGLMDLVSQALLRLGTRHALVVHGQEGLDEVSPVGPTQVIEIQHGRAGTYTITPDQFGIPRTSLDRLRGGAPAACARIAGDLLGGAPGPYREAALLNAGCALYVAGVAADIDGGITIARRALDSGRARHVLERLIRMTNAA